jgi:hypothetical protein
VPEDDCRAISTVQPVIVTLQAEIDVGNVVRVRTDLHAAMRLRAGL